MLAIGRSLSGDDWEAESSITDGELRVDWSGFSCSAIGQGSDQVQVLTESDTLDGGDVLPGFRLPLDRLFNQIGPSRGET
jgi:hypothetical protein